MHEWVKRTFRAVILVIGVTLLAGCSKAPQVLIFNRSGKDLAIVDTAGKQCPLGARGSAKIYLTVPSAFRLVSGDAQWIYHPVTYPPREYRSAEYPYQIFAALEKDMSIYVCFPDGREVSPQPAGFPLRPER